MLQEATALDPPRWVVHPVVEDVLCDREAQRNPAEPKAGSVLPIEVGLSVVVNREGVEHPVHAQVHAAAPVLYDHLPQSSWEVANVP